MSITKTTLSGLIAVFALTGAAPVHAQANCAVRETVIERLQMRFGEDLAAGGLRSERQVLEVWASAETGTWTVLVTTAEGVTCVLATGTAWHQNAPGLAVQGMPS